MAGGPFRPVAKSITRVFFSIENTGQTIAKIKQIHVGHCLWKDSTVPPHTFPQKLTKPTKPIKGPPTIAVIYPKETIKWEARSTPPIRLSEENLKKLSIGETILDLHGQILYDDIFDIQHYTRFCLTYHQRENDGKAEFIFPTDPSDNYNDAD
jgi:hypothetical protein